MAGKSSVAGAGRGKTPMRRHPTYVRCMGLLLIGLAAIPAGGQQQATVATPAAAAPNSTNAGTNPLLPTVPLARAISPSPSPATTGQDQSSTNIGGGSSSSSSAAPANGSVPDPAGAKTQSGLQEAQQQTEEGGGQQTESRNAPQNNVQLDAASLTERPGCANGNYLAAGVYGGCEVQGLLTRQDVELFSFRIAPPANGTRPYKLLIVLRTVDGDAQLGLSAPRNGQTDDTPEVVGTQVYGTQITSEVIIEVPWRMLASNPGRYIISIGRANGRALYLLRVLTPFVDVKLAEPDLSVMKEFFQACCQAADATSPLCTQRLPVVLSSDHDADMDLCNLTPMTCDGQGRLTQLSMPQAGLNCPAGLPASMGQLTELRTIDLAFNHINTTLDQLTNITGRLPALENLFMRYSTLTGTIPCDLVAPANLTRLSISGNNVTGSVPDCMLADPTLEELYLSQTGLTGPLPDVVPPGSPLRLLFAINYIQPEKTGLTGTIPASLMASAALTYMDLSNNALEGDVPVLPAQLRLLNLSNNELDGTVAGPLPGSLETFDVSYNSLTGPLPSDLSTATNLTLMDVSYNDLQGQLLAEFPPKLLVLDVSHNQLTGSPPAILPDILHYLNAGHNKLSGSLPSVTPDSLLRFLYLNSNNLTGRLPASLINGSAPLLFMNLHNNRLSGRLDGSEAVSGTAGAAGNITGRKLLLRNVISSVADSGLTAISLHNRMGLTRTGGALGLAGLVKPAKRKILQSWTEHVAAKGFAAAAADTDGSSMTAATTAADLVMTAHVGSGAERKLLATQLAALPGSTANNGRTLQQQQQQQPPATGSSAPPSDYQGVHGSADDSDSDDYQNDTEDIVTSGGGAVWAVTDMAYLDLSDNEFSGPIPAALGNLLDLVYLDVSINNLSGSLKPFSDMLAMNASDTSLMYLNASNNRLSGQIPDTIAYAPLLDPSRARPRRGAAPRVLDLSNNAFSGPFPSFLITQPALVEQACQGRCAVEVGLNGPDMNLECPEDQVVQQQQQAYLQQAGFECVAAAGQKVSLLSAVTMQPSSSPAAAAAGAPAANVTTAGKSNPSELNNLDSPLYATNNVASAPYYGSSSNRSHNQLAPGAIAGIVIGSVVGAALLATIIGLAARKYKKHRAGWRKDDLNGGANGVMNDAFGVATLPPQASAGTVSPVASFGSGLGRSKSINGHGANGFGSNNGSAEYPHSPYEQAEAGIEMLNSRSSDKPNDV